MLKRLVFGRSSERSRPEPPAAGGDAAGRAGTAGAARGRSGARGPGRGGGITRTCPGARCSGTSRGAGTAARSAGRRSRAWAAIMSPSSWTGWSIVRVAVHCRRRYRRDCGCPVPATVTAPGPPKAIGKGLFSNGFLAMLFTERFVAGRSMNSLVTGLARQGAGIAAGTLAGACAQAGALLVPLEEAIAARSRGSWHLHADETSWRVFAPREGDGPAKWWLWVFLGPDTVCFVMDPTRSGAVLARHAGIDEDTGQLAADHGRRAAAAGDLQRLLRRLPVRREEGGRAGEPVLLGAHPPVLRAGRRREPRPADVLDRRVAGADQGPVRGARAAHGRLGGRRPPPRRGKRRRRPPGWRRPAPPGTRRSP